MIQFMWQSKNHMKVRRIDHFSPAFVYPYFLVYSLTVGTITVAARVIMKRHMTTVGALTDVAAKISGFTVHNGLCSFQLHIRNGMPGRKEGIKRMIPYLLNLIIIDGNHLLSSQKDY